MEYQELIIKSLITLILAILAYLYKTYVKSKVDADKLAEIEKYAEWAVRTAEQIFNNNKDKRDFVQKYLVEKTADLDLDLSVQDISNIIEYTVNLIKYGQEYTRS